MNGLRALLDQHDPEELYEFFREYLSEKLLEINLNATAKYTYDDWLEYFRVITPARMSRSREKLSHLLPIEGYAAAARWIEIIQSPSKMDKLYQGRLKAEGGKSIMDIAVGDDDEAFYEALIQENVQQLNTSNISQQEVARITQNINIFRKELRDIRSRKPKKGTVLEKVLAKAAEPKKPKTPPKKKASKTASKAKLATKTGKVSSSKRKEEKC